MPRKRDIDLPHRLGVQAAMKEEWGETVNAGAFIKLPDAAQPVLSSRFNGVSYQSQALTRRKIKQNRRV
jgi:hypothetical protein